MVSRLDCICTYKTVKEYYFFLFEYTQHDQPDVEECYPGLPDGNFIMAGLITANMGPNKLRFSRCSTFPVYQLLNKRQDCFKSRRMEVVVMTTYNLFTCRQSCLWQWSYRKGRRM